MLTWMEGWTSWRKKDRTHGTMVRTKPQQTEPAPKSIKMVPAKPVPNEKVTSHQHQKKTTNNKQQTTNNKQQQKLEF